MIFLARGLSTESSLFALADISFYIMNNIKGGIFMFLAGMIIGMMIGVLLIKLRTLANNMDESAKQIKEDAVDTYRFWKERRKARQ